MIKIQEHKFWILATIVFCLFTISSIAQNSTCATQDALIEQFPLSYANIANPQTILVTRAEADGTTISHEIIVNRGAVTDAKASDNGEWVAYEVYLPDATVELWLDSIQDSNPQQLLSLPPFSPLEEGEQARPDSIAQWEWLPAQEMLVYTSSTLEENIVISEQSSAVQGRFAISPDAQVLALTNESGLYHYDISDSELVQIGEPLVFDTIAAGRIYSQPYWLADSSATLRLQPVNPLSVMDSATEIWQYSLNGEGEQIGLIDAYYFNIQFAPTMDKLIFWQEGTDGNTLFVTKINGDNPQMILEDVFFDRWMPNGESFSYQSGTERYLHRLCDVD